MIVKERQIILSKVKYGEADLILKVISSDGQVYSAIAKSALKSKKRFGGGVLEPTHYINATIQKKDTSDTERLSVLQEANIIDDFRGLKSDYDKLSLAFHFVRTVSTVAREGDAHPEIFNLLGHALKAAETTKQLSQLKLRFDLKLLHLQGVLPTEERFVPYLNKSIRDELDEVSDSHQISREVELMFTNYMS